jgi:hypothetical protein
MPPVSLRRNLDNFTVQNVALQSLLSSLSGLSTHHQKLLAEIALIRLCLLLENTIESACAKLICGANYLDQVSPLALATARSTGSALKLIQAFNRKEPLSLLKWNRAKTIRKNMNKVLAKGDPLFTCIGRHTNLINELRIIRNHVAHKSTSTTLEFRQSVVKRYGAARRGMTPGLYLLHPVGSKPPKLIEYLVSSRVFIRELLRA